MGGAQLRMLKRNLTLKEKYQAEFMLKWMAQRGLVVGTGDEIVDQLHQYEAAGLEKAMLQWLDLDDLKGLESMAEKVLA